MHTSVVAKEVPMVSVPELNETQSLLLRILSFWGPNGERHYTGNCISGISSDGRRCALRALSNVEYCGVWSDTHQRAFTLMERAAGEFGFHLGVAQCSDSGFDNARKMVLRAFELAGHHP